MKTILIKLSQCLMAAFFLACLNQRAYSQYSQDGLRGLNASVYTAAVDVNGNLYAGGDFVTVDHILGSAGGASAQYDAMFSAYDGSNNKGDAFAEYIAVWNPGAPGWSSLIQSPFQGEDGVSGTVKAIAMGPDGNVYVGGNFTWACDVPVNHIAYWNPTTPIWTKMGDGVFKTGMLPAPGGENLDGSVNSICISGRDVYIVGDFRSVNGGPYNIISTGLVDLWKAEGNALDSVGSNNGQAYNITYTAGEVGQAFSFNGTSGYVNIPDSPSLDSITTAITIELWMKSGQLTPNADWKGLVTKGNSAAWRLQATSGAKTVTWNFNTTVNSFTMNGSRNVNDGQWHHVAATYDGTNTFIYVDGTLDVSAPATGLIIPATDPVCIGANAEAYVPSCYCHCLGYFFNGLIDEVSIYNRALSATEIQVNYCAGRSGNSIPANNIARWNIDSSTWYYAGPPPPVGTPNTIVTSNGVDFYVGGVGGQSGYGVVHGSLTDGVINSWDNMGGNLTGTVNAIAISPITGWPIVGGYFTLDGGIPHYSLAEWNGKAFVAVPGPPSEYSIVNALATLNNNLIVGGSFYFPDNPDNPNYWMVNIAGFNLTDTTGDPWFPMGTYNSDLLGTGLGESIWDRGDSGTVGVYALAVSPEWNIVYAGGEFGQAAQYELVDNVAAWDPIANVWLPLNNAPPTISITASSDVCAPIVINAATSDDCGVIQVDFYANETYIGTVTATPPYPSLRDLSTWNPSFTWTPPTSGAYTLTAIATDTDGAQTPSAAITVNVLTTPTIATQPQSQAAFVGTPVTFSVVASGSDSLTYQWQFYNVNLGQWVNISGATGSSYTIASVTAADAGKYMVVVSDPCGSITSTTAALSVNVQTFSTPGTYYWRCPPGVVGNLMVECWGGGGGGGAMCGNPGQHDVGAGGGGGGAYAEKVISVQPGQAYILVVGAGGNNGSGGGDSTCATYVTNGLTTNGPVIVVAKGGNGVASSSYLGGAGGNAAECLGDIIFGGGDGETVGGLGDDYGGGGGGGAGSASAGGNASYLSPGSRGYGPDQAHWGGSGGWGAQTLQASQGAFGGSPGGGGGGSFSIINPNQYSHCTIPGSSGGAGKIMLTYTP